MTRLAWPRVAIRVRPWLRSSQPAYPSGWPHSISEASSEMRRICAGVGRHVTPGGAIAEILAALADEYEALNDHGRESLRMQVWAALPHLRERADRRAGRRLARLAGGGG